ncbi:hypothetical protein MD484_g3510, partial [Candolleomyces efflorescens]
MILAQIAVALTTALVASAQSTEGISPCIVQCSVAAAAANGCSAVTDFQCVCSNAQFQADATKCLQDHCPDQVTTAINIQLAQCGAASISPTGTAGPPRTLSVTIPSTTSTSPATGTGSGAPAATTSSGASVADVAWGAAGFAAAALGFAL